ncbi:hypothetical protein F444_20153 [Phytophthora nicotianae P1976]|uniref:Uncharacterized protein n=1 Tax=Phytophthora nicotianae P1976 TaxID=1317066 RepID=A0A080Z5H7_PHYNI|nr:hypothetical protein F444_20153 [Phytophthora nicotianae P1976]
MAPKPTLPACGYIVAGLGLPVAMVDELLSEAKDRTYEPVFKTVGGEEDDGLCKQSRISRRSAAIANLRNAICDITACLDPGWNPTVFSFVLSLPSGDEKEPRQDYPNEVIATAAKKKTGRIPASAIFALDEGTILRVFSGCFTTRDDTKACEVRIPVGYCIIFRGDLIPNGMPYAATNHRIHCYLS